MKIPGLFSRYIFLSAALFFISLILISCAQQKIAMRSLKENIQQELSKQEGIFAVAFKDLSTGKELLINDTVTFHAASTMKTPVLVEVYKQAAEGKFSLSDSLIIKNEFKSIVDGSLLISTQPMTAKQNYTSILERKERSVSSCTK